MYSSTLLIASSIYLLKVKAGSLNNYIVFDAGFIFSSISSSTVVVEEVEINENWLLLSFVRRVILLRSISPSVLK